MPPSTIHRRTRGAVISPNQPYSSTSRTTARSPPRHRNPGTAAATTTGGPFSLPLATSFSSVISPQKDVAVTSTPTSSFLGLSGTISSFPPPPRNANNKVSPSPGNGSRKTERSPPRRINSSSSESGVARYRRDATPSSSVGSRTDGTRGRPGAASNSSHVSHVRVVARIRPLSEAEEEADCNLSVYPHALDLVDCWPPPPSSSSSPATTADKMSHSSNGSPFKTSLIQNGILDGETALSNKAKTTTPPFLAMTKQIGSSASANSSASNSESPTSTTPTAPAKQEEREQQAPEVPQQQQVQQQWSKSIIAEVSDTYHKRFELDGVFGPATTQQYVYDQTVGGETIQRNILCGYSTTIIAYGQTGSGKTYTMGGPGGDESVRVGLFDADGADTTQSDPNLNTEVGEDDYSGVIPRAIRDVFKVKTTTSAKGACGEVEVRLSCLEIYNDELRDLLVEQDDGDVVVAGAAFSDMASVVSTSTQQQPQRQPQPLVMRDYGEEEGVMVKGVRTVLVESMEQVQSFMDLASQRRTTGRTRLNEHSSRSHAVCTLEVSILPPPPSSSSPPALGATEESSSSPCVISSKLTLVDLAGSERLKASAVDGLQKQESININKDLFVLGKVVSALATKEAKWHIPYRDSKLTRLLRDSLGGNCFTVLIACVKPTRRDVDESVNTLRYAERARAITNSFKPNIVSNSNMSPAECVSMRAENRRLKTTILSLRQRLQAAETTLKRINANSSSPKQVSTDDDDDSAELAGIQARLNQAENDAKSSGETCSGTLDLLQPRDPNTMMNSPKIRDSAGDGNVQVLKPSMLHDDAGEETGEGTGTADANSDNSKSPGESAQHSTTADGTLGTDNSTRSQLTIARTLSADGVLHGPTSSSNERSPMACSPPRWSFHSKHQAAQNDASRNGGRRTIARALSADGADGLASSGSGNSSGNMVCSPPRWSFRSEHSTAQNNDAVTIESLRKQLEQERKAHQARIENLEAELQQERTRSNELHRRCEQKALKTQMGCCIDEQKDTLKNDSIEGANGDCLLDDVTNGHQQQAPAPTWVDNSNDDDHRAEGSQDINPSPSSCPADSGKSGPSTPSATSGSTTLWDRALFQWTRRRPILVASMAVAVVAAAVGLRAAYVPPLAAEGGEDGSNALLATTTALG